MLRALEGNFNMINFKLTSSGSILMLFYDEEIKIKEEFTEERIIKYLAKGSDFKEFFENPQNAYEDNLIDYYLKDNILTLIFAEGNRRFVVCGNLDTKEKTKIAEWYV